MSSSPDAPVEIVPYDVAWPARFEAERARLAAKPAIDILAFRDLLRAEPEVATAYQQLKEHLAEQFHHGQVLPAAH